MADGSLRLDKNRRHFPLRDVTWLRQDFFERNPRLVARALLGKLLVRRSAPSVLVGRIVETEAYLGASDPASHSYIGKTPRNAVMFGPAGFAYVYFIYGNHYCLNVTCQREGVAGAVLFRAMEALAGVEEMAAARGIIVASERDLRNISAGPGRMAQALGVTRERDNGKNFVSAKSDLRIGDDGFHVRRVVVTARIGIVKAAERPLRFLIAGNKFVSGPKA